MNRKRAVFLDRDGTINVEKGYVHKIEDFEFIPGAPEAVALLRNAGFMIVVVTNQSGVARGYFPLETVHRLHGFMDEQLAKWGGAVDAYCICPHHPRWPEGEPAHECGCRKPLPGMLVEAAKRLSIDLSLSYMIGDKLSDAEAGLRAGCRSILVGSGCGKEETIPVPPGVPRYGTLLEAARAIIDEARGSGETDR